MTGQSDTNDIRDERALRACHEALVALLAAIDHGHATTAIDLFTEDASMQARGQQLRGHTEIAGFLAEREADTDRRTVHVLANETARQPSDNEIEIDALLVLLVHDPAGTYAIDRVLDTSQRMRRTARGWKIDYRSAQPAHRASDESPTTIP